jgi:hypothetical protein
MESFLIADFFIKSAWLRQEFNKKSLISQWNVSYLLLTFWGTFYDKQHKASNNICFVDYSYLSLPALVFVYMWQEA